MSDNSNRVYSDAYAAKVLKRENLSAGKKTNLKKIRVRSKPLYAEPKPIDKHGNYDGTDVGFTSDSIQKPLPKKQKAKKRKRSIDKHGNYDGTDVGFTVELDD